MTIHNKPMSFKPISVLMMSLSLLGVFSSLLFAENAVYKAPKGIKSAAQVITQKRVLMGTEVMIKVFSSKDRVSVDRALVAAFSEVSRLEKLMSSFIPESELSRINAQAGIGPVPVSRELYELITKALDFSALTDGAFDISFASVGKLWSFREKIAPTARAVKLRLPLVNYKKIRLDELRATVFLTEPGMSISLGGIGKGYAMDRAMAILRKHGIKNAMVMAGGDTLIRGHNDGRDWRIGLRDPDNHKGILAILPLSDQAISTSGDYERFFIKAGVRYHHILDTRTGFPAMLSRSVSILAEDATSSDALATSVFVMGPIAGLALINRLDGIEGIVIDPEGRLHLSSGLIALDPNAEDNNE